MSDKEAAQRADGMLLTILEIVTEGVKGVLDEKKAFDLGIDVVDNIRHTFGGELVYVCKGRTLDSIIKSNQIWNDFRGDNHQELSKKYNCSVQWIYEVVRTKHRLRLAEIQPDLFNTSE